VTGDLILVGVGFAHTGGSTSIGITDDQGNTYFFINDQASTVAGKGVALWYAIAGTSTPPVATVTWTAAKTLRRAVGQVFRGARPPHLFSTFGGVFLAESGPLEKQISSSTRHNGIAAAFFTTTNDPAAGSDWQEVGRSPDAKYILQYRPRVDPGDDMLVTVRELTAGLTDVLLAGGDILGVQDAVFWSSVSSTRMLVVHGQGPR
jgi:hypothetical protein